MEGDSRNPRVSLLKKYDIPIDHLSFEYIESCRDRKELERIVRILRSGEEGTYPDLIKTAENQLRQIAPESRVLRIETPILTKESFTNEEWKALEKELLSWEEEMSIMDKSLEFEKQRFDTVGNKNLPEVRKALEKKPEKKAKKNNEISKVKIETNNKNERIKSGDYAAWDKFDVDKELLKLDLEDERKQEKNDKLKRETERQNKKAEEKKIEPINIDPESYSNMEQQILANQAKDRGNECFKSGDFNNALKYYNASLKLCPTANAYNNRAMTYIKLGNYEEALKDCNQVLRLEPNNVKALHRRATAYKNLAGENNNELALKDLLKIVTLEPTNRQAQTELQALKKKLQIQDIGKKFRMMIEEIEDGDVKDFWSRPSSAGKTSYWNDNDELAAIRRLPLTYYGPSTSTFKCEPQSMTHRMLSDPTFSSEVMCKCNSGATRQNPLCYRCGEEASRPPKPRSKLTLKSKSEDTSTKIEVNARKEGTKQIAPVEKETSEGKVFKETITETDKNSTKSHGSILPCTNEKDKKLVEKQTEKSEVERNSHVESNVDEAKEKKSGFESLNESNKKVLENVAIDVEKDEVNNNESKSSDKINNAVEIGNNEIEASECVSKSEEISQDDAEVSLKEIKNISNEQCRDVGSHLNLTDEQESLPKVKSKDDEATRNVHKVDNENDETYSNNLSLPSTSSQAEAKKPVTKKRSRKKKSKELRQEESRTRYPEPVKIVQAAKYTNPTSSEPKPEVDQTKKSPGESNCHFKSFVPSPKGLGPESGILKSSLASHSSNVKDKDHRIASQIYASSNIGRHSKREGNKENIMETGNERPKTFDNVKSNNIDEKFVQMESSFQFMKSWESMKNSDESYEKRAEIIRLLRPEDLKTVIGNNLDSDMLKSLLECLEKHFLDNDPKKVISILKELPAVPRFGIVNLFLDRNERKVIERLIESTERKGFVLDEDVKNSLKESTQEIQKLKIGPTQLVLRDFKLALKYSIY